MKKTIFAFLVVMVCCGYATAQQNPVQPARVVATCGSGTLTIGQVSYATMTADGTLCTSTGGGGGGGAVTVANGADTAQGSTTDAKSTATDGTAATIVAILKELSFMAQTPAALPANQSVNEAQLAGQTLVDNPCQTVAGTTTAISLASSGPTVVIPAAAGKKTYYCQIILNSSDAAGETVSVVEGTGVNMATSQVALLGSTTSANGVLLAASGGGFVMGDGGYPVIRGKTNALDSGILANGSHRVSGSVTWVQKFFDDPRQLTWMLQ